MKFLVSALLALVFVPVASTLGQESTQHHPMVESEKSSQTNNIGPEHILREFKSYYIRSDTIYLHRETLQKELRDRPEFPAWGLTATEDSNAADVVITITLPFLTWEWNYRMVYQPTGTVLGTGKVSAAVEKTAAQKKSEALASRHICSSPANRSFSAGSFRRGASPNPVARDLRSVRDKIVANQTRGTVDED